MPIVSNEVLLNEAANIVARHENVSIEFVVTRYTTN